MFQFFKKKEKKESRLCKCRGHYNIGNDGICLRCGKFHFYDFYRNENRELEGEFIFLV